MQKLTVLLFRLTFTIMIALSCAFAHAQVTLNATGGNTTYELINSAFAPGYTAVEAPDVIHPSFGRHIAQVWDADLNKYVFEFYSHVALDNDPTDFTKIDRQRVEIKSYAASPDSLLGTLGETMIYKWRFKVPVGFQPSSNFTHIHQVKAVDGDDSSPLFTLTPRKGTPNQLELIYVLDSTSGTTKLATLNLSLFEGVWVEATEVIKVGALGTYSITLKKVSDGTVLLNYNHPTSLMTIRAGNSFIRPKWGIYRSLNTPADLRDETLRLSDLSITQGQLIVFPTLGTKEFSSTDFNAGATSTSGLAITYTSSNTAVATIVNGNIHLVGLGTAVITAAQAGNASYPAANNVSQTLTVAKGNQTITFDALPIKSIADTSFLLSAIASSGLAVTYQSANNSVATVVKNKVIIVGAGTVTITASQLGNSNYLAAPDVAQDLLVSPASIFLNAITATNPNTANPFTTGQVIDTAITVSGIGRGSSLSGSNATNSYTATGWNVSSLSSNRYFEFTLTPNVNKEINFSSFAYTGQVGSGGPTNISFRSSLDNYATSIGTAVITGTTIALTADVFQHIKSAIKFRIYAWSASSSSATYGINDFIFRGTVNCISPTIFSVTGGGSYCRSGTGLRVGLSGSELGVTYQLKINGASSGVAIAGTGAALDFGLKTLVGTYTVVATKVVGACNISATMLANASIAIVETSSSSTPVTICSSELPYLWNGNSFTAAGTYLVNLTNAALCDSAATLILTVKAAASSAFSASNCGSYTLPWGGVVSVSGDYVHYYSNATGCDSLVTAHVLITGGTSSTLSASACDSYTWTAADGTGQTYTSSGVYTKVTPIGSTTTRAVTNVASIAALQSAINSAAVGDTIVLANGTYLNNTLSIGTSGITVRAATAGGVFLNGTNAITLSGSNIIFSGFQFTSGAISGNVIEVNGNYNTLTQLNFNGYSAQKYIVLQSGQYHVISYSNFENKPTTAPAGNLIHINPSSTLPGYHKIRYCSFKNMPGLGGDNGNECIRISNGSTSTYVSRTTVEFCYFTNTGDGDSEAISVKCQENILRYNTFTNNQNAMMVFRNGDNNIAYGNFFIGAGGIRVKEANNIYCYNNYFENSGIGGSANAVTYLYISPNLKNVNFAHNTFVDCGMIDLASGATGNTWANNIFKKTSGNIFTGATTGINFIGNIYSGSLGVTIASGMKKADPLLVANTEGYKNLSATSPAINSATSGYPSMLDIANVDDDPSLLLDISKRERPVTAALKDVGCSEYTTGATLNHPLQLSEVGPVFLGGAAVANCNHTATLNLTIKSLTTSTTAASACTNYLWNGTLYTSSGMKTFTTKNAAGCDSIAILNLTITTPSASTTTVASCTNYLWNGSLYTTSGIKTFTTKNVAGCDSIATLNLTIKTPSASSTTASACGSYLWNGTLYTSSGSKTFTTKNAAGCDSIATLNLTIKTASTSSSVASACGSYLWNGELYTSSGSKTFTTKNAAGCDSIATLDLTIKNASASSTAMAACTNYLWNGSLYTTSGTKTFTTKNIAGCDSTATLELTIKMPSTSSTTASACGSYLWNGTLYTSSGSKTFTTKNAAGCDSIATLNLIIKSASTSTTTASACGSYLWNGTLYTTSGIKTFSTKNAADCDSIASLNLTIKTASSSTTNRTICASALPYSWNSTSFPAAGTYTVILSNAAGCDSVATLTLSVNNFSVNEMDGPNNACPYAGTALLDATYSIAATNASGYLWTLPVGAVLKSGSLAGNTISVHFADNFVNGTIAVSVSSDCAAAVFKSIVVTKTSPATPTAISGKAVPCTLSTGQQYSVVPVNNVTSYNWTVPSGWAITAGAGTNAITVNVGAVATGSITVKTANICGMSNAVALPVVVVAAIPAAPSVVTGLLSVCEKMGQSVPNDTVRYQIGVPLPIGIIGYNWKVSNSATMAIVDAAVDSSWIAIRYLKGAFVGGAISVNAVSNCAKGTAVKTLTIASVATSTPTALTGLASVCARVGGDTVRYTATGAKSYSWQLVATTGGAAIVAAAPDSAWVAIQYSNGFTKGTIAVKGVSACGIISATAKILTLTTVAPATPTTLLGLTSVCAKIGLAAPADTVRYSVGAGISTASRYRWKITSTTAGKAAIVDASADSSWIAVRYMMGFTGGKIEVRSVSACGLISTAAKAVTLSSISVPSVPTTLTSSSTMANICSLVGTSTTANFTAKAVAGATNYVWTLPSGAVLVSGAGTNLIGVQFNTLKSTDSLFVQASTGCAISAKRGIKLIATNCLPDTSPVAGRTQDMPAPLSAKVYPNPNGGNFIISIHTPFKTGMVKMQLLNARGRVLEMAQTSVSFDGSAQANFFLNGVAAGTYWVKYLVANQSAAARVLIIP